MKSFNLKLPEDKVIDLVSKNRDTLRRCIYNLNTTNCFMAAQASIDRLLDIFEENTLLGQKERFSLPLILVLTA